MNNFRQVDNCTTCKFQVSCEEIRNKSRHYYSGMVCDSYQLYDREEVQNEKRQKILKDAKYKIGDVVMRYYVNPTYGRLQKEVITDIDIDYCDEIIYNHKFNEKSIAHLYDPSRDIPFDDDMFIYNNIKYISDIHTGLYNEYTPVKIVVVNNCPHIVKMSVCPVCHKWFECDNSNKRFDPEGGHIDRDSGYPEGCVYYRCPDCGKEVMD